MAKSGQNASLTAQEKRIVKALLNKGWRNQDIHALINHFRPNTVNSGRITGIKKDASQTAASDDEVAFYQLRKRSYDVATGLNQYDNERLVRAREAMILAVQIFNSPALKFKAEVYSVLANIAWTYLLHEYYIRKGISIMNGANSISLSDMLKRSDCPLSEEIKLNLKGVKIIRDKVEHLLLGRADLRWSTLYQACCLNFDKMLCQLFGADLTLSKDLSLALQFAKLSIEQAKELNKYDVPADIAAIDALITEGMSQEQINNTEFQFKVIYTFSSASKGSSHFQFVSPETAEGKEIHNVLSKKVPADELFPHKPGAVISQVAKASGKKFNSADHTRAWNLYKVRPRGNSSKPGGTDKRYCWYNTAHKDYTYSDAWVKFLVGEVSDPQKYAAIQNTKI